MNSIPAASQSCASSRLCSHEASQLSGTVVIAQAPRQFGANSPSFIALPLNIAFARPNIPPVVVLLKALHSERVCRVRGAVRLVSVRGAEAPDDPLRARSPRPRRRAVRLPAARRRLGLEQRGPRDGRRRLA